MLFGAIEMKSKMSWNAHAIINHFNIAKIPNSFALTKRLGNEFIHRLTTEGDPVVLRVELEDFDGVMAFAEYETFR